MWMGHIYIIRNTRKSFIEQYTTNKLFNLKTLNAEYHIAFLAYRQQEPKRVGNIILYKS